MNRRSLIGIAAVVLASALGAGPTLAQQKTVIKIGWITSDGAQDPYAIGARTFKQALERHSGGRIEVQLFPNRQLGDEKADAGGHALRHGRRGGHHQRRRRAGRARFPGERPAVPVLRTRQQAHKVLDGKVGQTLAKKLEAKGIIVARLHGGRLPPHDQ